MKLKRWFYPRQLLFVLLASPVFIGLARGQDIIVTRDGITQRTKIVGTTATGVQIQVGAGQIAIPLANIASVRMAPPAQFNAGLAAYAAGDLEKAFAEMKAVSEKFKGLPTEWAQQAASTLGDIFVAQNKLTEAEAAYQEFQRIYPGAGTAPADVGLARIAVAKKDFESAKQKIAPLLAQALKEKTPPKNLELVYSQAFYISGETKEATGDFTGALEDYLRTVTLYPADRIAVNAAQERAEILQKEHGVAVP